MTRVWLTEWEWACCGTPFVVGDRVEFATTPGADPWLERMLGAELAATIDAVESHHEDPGPERVTGRVAAIQALSIGMRHRRVRRDPHREPPMTSTLTLTADDGRPLAWAAAPATDWYVVGEDVPDTATLRPAERVPSPPSDGTGDRHGRVDAAVRGEGPEEWEERSLAGWIVAVEDLAAAD